jgi:hypothetical protein
VAERRDLGMVDASLRTPRAAAVSGLIFSALLIVSLSLITVSAPHRVTATGTWLMNTHKREAFKVALGLIPFAGIAFLWFIGVVRDRVGDLEDRFFATVFLGSGLLFVGMLFVAAAFGSAIIADIELHAAGARSSATIAQGRQVSFILIHDYALRMAGVFTMSTATILHRTKVAPRWLAACGFVVAAVLILAVGLSPWLELLFPAWIGLLSIETLRRTMSVSSTTPRAAGVQERRSDAPFE